MRPGSTTVTRVFKNQTMDEEQLITLVQGHRELYDPEYKYYEDQPRREAAWREIASKLRISAHDCKDRWKRIRDNYRRARKLRITKKAQGCKKIKAIKFETLISFMDHIIDNFNRREKGDQDDDDSGSDRQEPDATNAPLVPMPLDPLIMEKSYPEPAESQSHPLTTFFANLGETVKTFPEEIQIRVKRDIFKIINEAEEEVYRKRRKLTHVSGANIKYEMNDY